MRNAPHYNRANGHRFDSFPGSVGECQVLKTLPNRSSQNHKISSSPTRF